MEPDFIECKRIDEKGIYKHNLLLKEDMFTDKELGISIKSAHSSNPWVVCGTFVRLVIMLMKI